MQEPPRWPPAAWVPIATGLCWLWLSAGSGAGAFVLSLPFAVPLVGSGVGLLLWPGDRRISRSGAFFAVLGVTACPVFAWLLGPGPALALGVLAAASALASARRAIVQEALVPDVPAPENRLRLDAQVAIDEAILGYEQLVIHAPRGAEGARVAAEVEAAEALFSERGWLDDPLGYHQEPPPLTDVEVEGADSRGIAYERLRCASGYEPHPEEPGAARWRSHHPVQNAYAYVLRHGDDRERPWMVCSNGFRMGHPFIDLRVFRHFHRRGLNVLIPVLPLHGDRRIGRQSGDGFLAGDVLDTVHALAQAMWDSRRWIDWLRSEQGARQVGIHGLSLGGYKTALLAGLVDDLACAIAGIPLIDISEIFWLHGPQLTMDWLAGLGADRERVDRVMRVVSPLAVKPRVPEEGRFVFGGVADRLVPPNQVRRLWEHWDRPPVVWYQGGHLTFELDPRVSRGMADTLTRSGLLA